MAFQSTDPYAELARVPKDSAKEWQRNRAATERRKEATGDARLDYSLIQFPPLEECRHAALVICGRYADEPEIAIEILEALALPTILRAGGGDGRVMKISRKKLPYGPYRDEPLPLGYDADDFGQVQPKRKRS